LWSSLQCLGRGGGREWGESKKEKGEATGHTKNNKEPLPHAHARPPTLSIDFPSCRVETYLPIVRDGVSFPQGRVFVHLFPSAWLGFKALDPPMPFCPRSTTYRTMTRRPWFSDTVYVRFALFIRPILTQLQRCAALRALPLPSIHPRIDEMTASKINSVYPQSLDMLPLSIQGQTRA